MILTGGCFCRAIRYRSTLPVLDTGYCHCTICQKISGAPAVVWVSVPKAGFSFTRGTPTRFASSSRGDRYFCPQCGTHLMFAQTGLDEVDLTVTTLDEDCTLVPEYHIWTAHQRPWLTVSDNLPNYADNGPDR